MAEVEVGSRGVKSHFDGQRTALLLSPCQFFAKLPLNEDFLGAFRQVRNLSVDIHLLVIHSAPL